MPTTASSLLRKRAESAVDPDADHDETSRKAYQQDQPAGDQAVLQPESGSCAIEPLIVLAEVVRGVGTREQSDLHRLGPDDGDERARDERMEVPLASEHAHAR